MRGVVVVLLLTVVLLTQPVRHASAQCTAPGCDSATSVVAAARATARVILTENAPRPTETPVPTWTAAPTSTPTPTPTLLPTLTPTSTPTQEPTPAPAVVVLTPTTEPDISLDRRPGERISLRGFLVVAIVAGIIGVGLIILIYRATKPKITILPGRGQRGRASRTNGNRGGQHDAN